MSNKEDDKDNEINPLEAMMAANAERKRKVEEERKKKNEAVFKQYGIKK